jgi:hypothetical protein
MKRQIFSSLFLGFLASISTVIIPNKANALTLLNSVQDYTNLSATYSWDGSALNASLIDRPTFASQIDSGIYSPSLDLSSFEWWRVQSTPFSLKGGMLFLFDHRPSPYSANYDYSAQIDFGPVNYNYAAIDSTLVNRFQNITAACEQYLVTKSGDYCKDTFTISYAPNTTGAGGIFNITGERVSNVPEPLTILGSGLAIAFGAFLKKHRSRSPIVSSKTT